MMLDTADNKIYFPRFYDIDTICSYDNSGQLKFDVDIEMEQGYWNTSSSRLWTRIRDLMYDDIVTTYNNMRQNGVSYENMMHYIYDEQIAKIPQAYYNKDYDIKYAPFADSYIGMAHGDTYEHVKRWLKQRFTFVDTLFDYAPSYNNDVLTIRANTTELMTLEIETYTPVYQHVSWYNGQMDKKKIDGKVSVEFSGTAQAATDQEVLIYGGSNVKSIKGITSMNPNRMLIGSATKLIEIDAHDCPLLADINANKANLSPHEYLNKVNLSNCPLLEGNLRLNNSPLVQELDIRGTNITGMNLSSSIRNLQTLRLPNTITELTLNDASMLHTLEFDEGVALQSISMTNCNALENVINFDLLQTPSITLNNSYNNVAELYFRDTTNLSLSNMSNLEKVIFTPNNEYETFELINVANAPNYKVTTFNCPKLSTFMTTAPYRESYNNVSGYVDKEIEVLDDVILVENYSPKGVSFAHDNIFIDFENDGYIEVEVDLSTCINTLENIISFGLGIDKWTAGTEQIHMHYDTPSASMAVYDAFNRNQNINISVRGMAIIRLDASGVYINGTKCCENSLIGLNSISIGSQEGNVRSNALYNYIKYCGYHSVIIQVKDYGDIQSNTAFTANSIDISNTQFTDVKLLCTTDTNTLKLPITVKNFYCDSSFDLDTDWLEDGKYDVVHGELVEPYTTDYEGEVVRVSNNETSLLMKDICTIPTSYINEGSGEAVYNSAFSLSDFIEVVSGTQIALNFWVCRVSEYNADKLYIKQTSLYNNGTQTLFLDSNCKYIRVHAAPNYLDDINVITCTPLVKYVPNLIPSSADGSLIFSMYAPSKAPAPTSNTWDLYGLEFDNFHTYGMNNDVKPSEDSYVKCYTDKIIAYHASFWGSNSGTSVTTTQKELLMIFDKLKLFGEETSFTITASDNKVMQGGHINSGWTSGNSGKNGVTPFTWNTNADTPYLVAKVSISDEVEWIQFNDVRINLSNLDIREVATTSPITEGLLEVNTLSKCNMILGNSPTSISMPARYDDYNITIKNANISPKTHNTMLYPLLVNEDNPIEGKLDYTNYTGKHLSWSFAYVNMNKVNIVQPKDELLNTYEYRYNAFYETEYEFDDPNEVLRYITSSSNLLPTFNEGFTYTYDKLDNNDGTYIYRIYANDPTLLTSFELEKVPYLRITNAENLLSPIDLTKYETVSISESYYDITELYFREATNLTLTNMPYLERVIYLPNDEYEVFEIINVVNSKDYIITTSECPRLTTFMTTASHRESYNNEDAIAEVITEFTNTDNELFTNEYVFSKTYWEEDGTEIQGSVNLLHYEIPSIEDSVKAIHMVQGLDSTNRVTFFNDDKFISCEVITTACELDFKLHRNCNRIVFICEREGIVSSVVESILTTTLVKEYGSIEPNIIFNANTLDISNTQFTDVKLLCTTDLNVLKLPTTVKNFYCDSSFDLDTDYLEDGEYDVVHGELVEQYTTDYEGEVNRYISEVIYYPKGDSIITTDFIKVVPGTDVSVNRVSGGYGYTNYIYEYKSADTSDSNGSTSGMDNVSTTLKSDTNYIRIQLYSSVSDYNVTLTKAKTPNLIPSSADGSLIFSMYAPNNTVAPASNTWDLYGLEFDNFHTFGMNNDVKGDIGYIKVGNHSELVKQRGNISTTSDAKFGDISVNNAERITIVGFELPTQESSPHVITTSNGKGYRLLTDEGNDGTQNNPGYFYGSGTPYTWGSNNTHKFILELNGLDIEWINIDGVYYYIDKIRDLGIINPAPNYTYVVNLFDYATSFTKISEYSFKIDEIKSLSMSSRYNNYNITIKNANISPKTHNTMLYPLLVNEDNPIEGKLDYTDYNGEYLSWSFAYTNTNKVNIIQPKDELLNSYGYRYNAFYRTEYEFDNPNEVMEYTTTSSNLLPIFNEGFTYAYDKIDNDNGTYTYKIYANDISLLTSFELEKVPYLRIVNAENLVSPIDLTKYEVVEIDNSYSNITELYFRDSTNLTLSNMSNLERVIYLPNDEYEVFELINVANAPDYKVTTFNCPKLSTFMTTAPYRESYNNCEYEIEEIVKSETNFEVGAISSNGQNQVNPNRLRYKDYITYNGSSTAGKVRVICSNSNIGVVSRNYDSNYNFLGVGGGTWVTNGDFDVQANTKYIRISIKDINTDKIPSDEDLEGLVITIGDSTIEYKIIGTETITIIKKDYGDIQPNATFTANSIDISNTQFTDVKLLCTTDTNTLKLPTTVKNFYCDSSFDLDTYWLEDGEYDVVHGELVEPYTTDYEGEVVLINPVRYDFEPKDSKYISIGTENPFSGTTDIYKTTGKFYITAPYGGKVHLLDNNKNIIKTISINYLPTETVYGIEMRACDIKTENPDAVYFQIVCEYADRTSRILIFEELFTPNLIPSSADGSLIFSMYAPSNTVAPASGTWDLKGLEFDNFHTYGMNNDVKGGYNNYLLIDTLLTDDKFNTTETVNFTEGEYIEVSVDLSGHTINELENVIAFGLGDINTWGSDHKVYAYYNGSSKELRMQLCKNNNISGIKPIVNGTNLTIRFDKNGIWYNGTLATGFDQFMNEWVSWFDNQKINIWITNDSPTGNIHYNYIMVKHKDIYSLTMPSRYDDYNITIKNANISPKTHNTMLYPLLVNEDNPITGTLDYTNYAGKHLSWSFAYTDEEYVNIIQPKDELLNSYEYRYNAFYDTEYEFDNPYEVARYISSSSGVLPEFNKEFTYTYDEIDNGDGTCTTKVYANDLDNLPTSISFSGKGTLLTVDKLNTSNVDGFRWMFNGCTSLTSMNAELDTNKVTNVYGMFTNCYSLTNLNSRNWIMPNITTTQEMFYNCNKLTTLDLSSLIGGKVTTTYRMFYGCSSLTSLDISEFDTSDVTNMNNMFNGCSSLTSLDVSGFDTGSVTNMGSMFFGCGVLSLDVKDWNVEKVTNMYGIFSCMPNITSIDINGWVTTSLVDASEMFHGSEKLTTVDATGLTFASSPNTKIDRMFYNCYGLTEVIGVETWDVSKVTHMNSVFRMNNNNNKLTSLNLASWDVGNVIYMPSMFAGCRGLTSLDVSGFDTKNVTDMNNMFYGCSGLTSLDVSGFNTSKVTDMNSMFQNCSSLIEIKGIEDFNVNLVSNFTSIFSGTELTVLDLSTWTPSNYTKNWAWGYAFSITTLTSLDLSSADFANLTDLNNMFRNAASLVSFNPPINIVGSLDLNGTKLDTESLIKVINNLATVTTSQTLTLGSTLLAKLTEDQIAIAINKGWTVA